MSERDQKEADWVSKHTLSEQDVRQLILEKMERAKILQKVEENRRLNEFA